MTDSRRGRRDRSDAGSRRPILLIDAKNALYTSVFAARTKRAGREKSGLAIFLMSIAAWVDRHKPESVHIFWDSKKRLLWRRKIYDKYKSNRKYDDDVSGEINDAYMASFELFEHMNIRQYMRDGMEADDLIYAAVRVTHPLNTIIISTDSDMAQIPFVFSSCRVWDPRKQKFIDIPDINPAYKKSLTGDKADNIDGYYGIGPKKAEALLSDNEYMHEFFSIKGNATYFRNLALIDLSLCPLLLSNIRYVMREMAKPVRFDKQRLFDIAKKYKIKEILTRGEAIYGPFFRLSGVDG